MAKKKSKFYAVALGRRTGIFETWNDCEKQVKGFKGAKFKSFPNRVEALAFLHPTTTATSTKKRKEPPPPNNDPHPTKRPNTEATTTSSIKTTTTTTPPLPFSSSLFSNINNKKNNRICFSITFDGGSRGNPGLAGCGAEIICSRTKINSHDSKNNDDNNNATTITSARTKYHIRQYLGTNKTNNQAEFQGILSALERVYKTLLGTQDDIIMKNIDKNKTLSLHIYVQGDSQLIINMLKGQYQCSSPKLKPLYHQTKDILNNLQQYVKSCSFVDDYQIYFEHVYRRDNTIADGLANQAMDARRSWNTAFDENGNVVEEEKNDQQRTEIEV